MKHVMNYPKYHCFTYLSGHDAQTSIVKWSLGLIPISAPQTAETVATLPPGSYYTKHQIDWRSFKPYVIKSTKEPSLYDLINILLEIWHVRIVMWIIKLKINVNHLKTFLQLSTQLTNAKLKLCTWQLKEHRSNQRPRVRENRPHILALEKRKKVFRMDLR